jgi:SNF2 family DNA or RNA helicase
MPQLAKTKWFHVIGDEIQAIKNRDAKVTLALKKIKTVYKSGLSGTAADNRPDDLWSILNWLYPNHWTSYWSWYNNHILFTNELNHKTGKVYRKMVGVANVDEIHGDMDSFYIARLKKDVFHDLPDKYYTDIEVDLAPQQRSAYNQMRDTMLAWIGEHEHEPIAAPVVIAQLMRLQQFAVGYGKLEPVKRRNPRTGEMELVDTLKLTEPSSKLDAVMEQILTNPDEQFVVFSQSKQVINLLATRLEKAKITHCLFTGDTKQEVRPQMVDDFQAGKYQVFAGTIHAGGVGITLTAASTVIFIDRAWSPSRNKQAEDRLHRPGQKNAVQVINIVARDTIDPDRNAQIQLKWEWLSELLRRGISD